MTTRVGRMSLVMLSFESASRHPHGPTGMTSQRWEVIAKKPPRHTCPNIGPEAQISAPPPHASCGDWDLHRLVQTLIRPTVSRVVILKSIRLPEHQFHVLNTRSSASLPLHSFVTFFIYLVHDLLHVSMAEDTGLAIDSHS